MAENATNIIPPKGLGSVDVIKSFLKGLYYAIIGQVIYVVVFLIDSFLQEHPHLPTWVEWLPYIKPIVYQIAGYIIGKLGVNNVGEIFTRNKPVVQVDQKHLEVVSAKAEALDKIAPELSTEIKLDKDAPVG